MTPLKPAEIRGNWATLLLPIQKSEAIDFALLADEIDHFIAARVNGIYSNGSAGEFHTQTEEEFDRVSLLLAEKCTKANMPFQIGACHMSAQLSRERLRRTKALRPSAFQVILPDWFPLAWPEIITFLETMAAEAAPIPLVVYNPPHAKRCLSPQEWLELATRIPGIAGIKVPGGDDAWYRAMQPAMAKLSVFIPGHLLATGLSQGAHGAYSNVACLSPAGAQRWYDLCIQDSITGLRWQKKILSFWITQIAPLITVHRLCNMAADKAAAAAGGWLLGMNPRLRWPYRSAEAHMIRSIADAAQREIPELFNSP